MAEEQDKKPNAFKRGWDGFAGWMGENTAHKVIFGFSTAAVVLAVGAGVAMGPVAQSVIMPIVNAAQAQSSAVDADKSDNDDSAATPDASNATEQNQTTDANATAATTEQTQTTNAAASNASNNSSNSTSNNSSNNNSSNNSSSSNSSNNNSSSSSSSSSQSHTHTWVAKTRTVTDEAGHWKITKQEWDETITSTNRSCKHYRCTKCGAVGDHNLGAVSHNISNCDGSLVEITRYDNPNPTTEYSTKHHDAEKEWVPAVTHTETYYVCSGCGQEQ